MRSVDSEILELLSADPALHVVDGEPHLDGDGKVSEQVPYVVYRSNLGRPGARRHTGRSARRVVTFRLTFVGFDREQAKAHGERAARAIDGRRLPSGGLIRLNDNSAEVVADPDARTTGNQQLHYGSDQYSVLA